MIMKVLFFISTLFLAGCYSNKIDNARFPLEGNWFYVLNEDSSYNEIYFSKEFLFYNLNTVDVGRIYQYSISNDTVYFTDHNQFLFKIVKIEEDQILLLDKHKDEILLERLYLEKPSFSNLMLSNEARINLQIGRVERGPKVLLERGLFKESDMDSGEDSVLFIPEPEPEPK